MYNKSAYSLYTLFLIAFFMVIIPLKESYAAQTTGRMPGAKLVAASCDPEANPSDDSEKSYQVDAYFPERSCRSQNITGDNFKIKISFDPNYPEVDGFITVTEPGDLKFPDNISAPLYLEDGRHIQTCDTSGCTAVPLDNVGFFHVDVGSQIIYSGPVHDGTNVETVYGEPVYLESQALKYPTSGPFKDQNDNQFIYNVNCDHGHAVHPAGSGIEYEDGKSVLSESCEEILDCNGNVVIAGADIYIEENGSCVQLKQTPEPVNSDIGPDKEFTVQSSLFSARFLDPQNDQEFIKQLSESDKKSDWLSLSDEKTLIKESNILFQVRQEGSKACVYAYNKLSPEIEWRVERTAPINMDQVNDIYSSEIPDYSIEPGNNHCVEMPQKDIPYETLNWGEMISEACTDSSARISKWYAPFSGVVVQCIEETMMRIFIPSDNETYIDANGNEVVPATFFSNMQDKLKSAIRGLLALYIIFFGFKLMVAKEVPQKSEWMWLGIKVALVVYFAIGSGMIDLLPRLVDFSKGMSNIFIQASLNYELSPQTAAARRANIDANYELKLAHKRYKDQESAVLGLESAIAKAEFDSVNLVGEIESKRLDWDIALAHLNSKLAIKNSEQAALNEAKSELGQIQADFDSVVSGISGEVDYASQISEELRTLLCQAGGVCYGGVNGVADGEYYQGSNLEISQNQFDTAQQLYNTALTEYNELTQELEQMEADLNSANQLIGNSEQLLSDAEDLLLQYEGGMEAAKVNLVSTADELSTVIEEVESRGGSAVATGYNYCDFRGLDYPEGKETWRLWDTLDCRISKYLGIGASEFSLFSPSVIYIAVLSVVSTPWGIPILALSLVFVAFMFVTIMTIVNTYLLAFVGLVLLVYISPLIIPAALFKWSENIFKQWLGQVVAFVIQPIILFAFLGFMFPIMDKIVMGENHHFVAGEFSAVPYKIANKNNLSKAAESTKECNDRNSIACIYQSVEKREKDLIDFIPGDFNISLTVPYLRFEKGDDTKLVVGLLKMLLLSFILYTLLESARNLSTNFVNAMGGGASQMAGDGALAKASPLDYLKAPFTIREKALKGKELVKGARNTIFGESKKSTGINKSKDPNAILDEKTGTGSISKERKKEINKIYKEKKKQLKAEGGDDAQGTIAKKLKEEKKYLKGDDAQGTRAHKLMQMKAAEKGGDAKRLEEAINKRIHKDATQKKGGLMDELKNKTAQRKETFDRDAIKDVGTNKDDGSNNE